jgi:hypothetical protein
MLNGWPFISGDKPQSGLINEMSIKDMDGQFHYEQ